MKLIERTCLALAGGAALAFAAPGRAQDGPPPTPVRVEAVRREIIQQRRMVTGDLRAVRQSEVAAREPGVVIELPVDAGSRVQPGSVLVRLDGSRLEVELDQLTAADAVAGALLNERKAGRDRAKRDLELVTQSFEAGAAKSRELLDAQSELAVAEARVVQAERELDAIEARRALLQKRLDDMVITAPFDGVVVARRRELGEWVGEGDAVVRLLSLDEVEARLDVSQDHFAAVTAAGASIAVLIEATGETIVLDDFRIVPQVDLIARSFTLLAPLPEGVIGIAPGMSITAWVPTSEEVERTTVSRNAVLRNDSGAFVFVARGSGEGAAATATPIPVRVLHPIGDRLVVESAGLRPGDLAIVEGNERLFPGMPVAPVEAPRERVGAESAPAGNAG